MAEQLDEVPEFLIRRALPTKSGVLLEQKYDGEWVEDRHHGEGQLAVAFGAGGDAGIAYNPKTKQWLQLLGERMN